MKIRYLPSSPKHPLIEHVKNEVGNVLVAAGFAEAIPMPDRRDPAWGAARAEEEKLRNPQCFAPPVISWGLLHDSRATIIQKTVNGNVFRFETPPADCPAKIVAQFRSYLRDFAKEQAELEKRKNEIGLSDARAAEARRW
jgi:hypothetical protein